MWYKLTAFAQRNFADAADREKESHDEQSNY